MIYSPEDGSSPLTRGKRVRDGLAAVVVRLIPAHAGKTIIREREDVHGRAHPRSRGENLFERERYARSMGSSPLTRGKRQARRADHLGTGLIPAHAGKTLHVILLICCVEAHPRSRGENQERPDDIDRPRGSSPLTRGKP